MRVEDISFERRYRMSFWFGDTCCQTYGTGKEIRPLVAAWTLFVNRSPGCKNGYLWENSETMSTWIAFSAVSRVVLVGEGIIP